MDEILESFTNEAIKLELKMYEIYTLFHDNFPEDASFWRKLASEELNHAETVRKIKPFLYLDQEMLSNIVSIGLESLKNEYQKMQGIIDDFKKNSSRINAFNIALELENSGLETFYQVFIDSKKNSDVSVVFKTLTGDDKNHAQRIQNYMNKHFAVD